MRFQDLFHSPPGVLFAFPSRYWFTIGRSRVFSLGGWSPIFRQDFTCPALLVARSVPAIFFAYGAITHYRPTFPDRSANNRFITCRLIPVRSPLLWGISVDFFSSGYLDVSVLPVRLHILCIQDGIPLAGGFPHSDIGDQSFIASSPAFRRLARPSSPVIAKASTTCTLSLDPITLHSVSRDNAIGELICAHHHRAGSKPRTNAITTHVAPVSSTATTHFFHFC